MRTRVGSRAIAVGAVFVLLVALVAPAGAAPPGAEEPPIPTFTVFWDGDNISGSDWTPDSPVTITIDDDDDPTTVLFTYDSFTDEGGFFGVGGDQGFDIQAGHYVVVTDGTFTKNHWVTSMMFTGADPDTDIVTGTAEPGSFVLVEPDMPLPVLPLYVRDEVFFETGPIRVVQADEFGNWVADFSMPWQDQGAFDITAETTGFIFQFDEDEDATGESWEVPPDEPVMIDVAIDIKPGEYPNSLNINGHGVIPVAVLGKESFDVTQIDVATLDFAGLAVKTNKKGKVQCSFQDVSGDFATSEGAPDGFVDLVCQFAGDPAPWNPDNGTATLTGLLIPEHGAIPFAGSDDFRLVPPD